jgi:pyruvate dehydrogenase complex dehydrogenase (E1) component
MPPPFKEQISKSGTICEKEPLPETWLCVNWNLEALVGVIMGSGKGTRVNENFKFGVRKWTVIIGSTADII